MQILGIDLAWGDKKGDARVKAIDYTRGDDALMAWVEKHVGDSPVMILVDAPLVCPNATGSRFVDKQISSMFWRQHAGCHSANSTKCQRPVRIAKKLGARSFNIGWDTQESNRLLIEVYPHPAIVRFFGLDRIVKYKKGRVAGKRLEFHRLQGLTRKCLDQRFPKFHMTEDLDRLLKEDWNKAVEDRTDAFLCALIGYNHYLFQGMKSEVIGTCNAGFILLPK